MLNVVLCHGKAILSLLRFMLLQPPFNSGIRNQPQERDEYVQTCRDPWTDKRECDSDQIDSKREFPLPLPANGLRHKGAATFLGDDSALENNISDSCH